MRKNVLRTICFLTLALIVGLLAACVDTPETNYDELQVIVDTHEDRDEIEFSEETWASYIIVYNEATKLIEDKDSSQDKVDLLTAKLNKAIEDLEPFIADTVALEVIISLAELLEKENYTSSTWSTLSFRLQAAKTLLEKVGSTQKEVDASTKGLIEAITKLR